jgi:hypothetical protein
MMMFMLLEEVEKVEWILLWMDFVIVVIMVRAYIHSKRRSGIKNQIIKKLVIQERACLVISQDKTDAV